MALFKILSNMDDPTKSMPNSYHQGYCYFDVTTGKFWIDTSNAQAGRMAINANHADSATLSQAAVYATSATINGTTDSVSIQENYAHSLYYDSTENTIQLKNGLNGNLGSPITLGSSATIYHWSSTTT